MYLDAADASALLVQGLSAALKERNVIVLAYDHNTDQPAYPARTMYGAPGMVDGVAWHCYAGSLDWSAMTTFQQNNPNVQQVMTECEGSSSRFCSSLSVTTFG